jgi:dienelactone hydrolase
MSTLTLGLEGCFQENFLNSFWQHSENAHSTTLETCLKACEGHANEGGISACGFIAGVGCMGGDYTLLYSGATRVPDSQCGSSCDGANLGLTGACGNPDGKLFSIFKMGFGDLSIPSAVLPNKIAADVHSTVFTLKAAPLGIYTFI